MTEQPGPDQNRFLARVAHDDLEATLVISNAIVSGKLSPKVIGIPSMDDRREWMKFWKARL